MSRRPWEISRRHLLRGIGATMSLPLLEAMGFGSSLFAKAAKGVAPTVGTEGQAIRFGALFMPNGVNKTDWNIPTGKLEQLSPILSPLQDLREYVNVFSGLRVNSSGHGRGTSCFLTGADVTRTQNAAEVNVGNASIDQLIANLVPGTILPSLELGMSKPRGGVLFGDTGVYCSHICWKDATTPVLHELNPERAFDRLFKGMATSSGGASASKEATRPDKGVVDAVLEDAKSLMKRVGKADQQKLDQYLSAVREVETSMLENRHAMSERVITPEMARIIRDTGRDIKKSVRDHAKTETISTVPEIPYDIYCKLMIDVMALAFWSNSTRVSTLMFGDGFHTRNMSFIDGVKGNHHTISHHGGNTETLKQYTLINTFFIQQYAYLCQKLKGMEEGGSNVLENSILLFGSSMSDGQVHSPFEVPLIVAGRGGSRIKTGRSVQAKSRRTGIGEMHRAILDTMNLDPDGIGDGGSLLSGFDS